MKKKHPSSSGIPLQKKHGQYFLRDSNVIFTMIDAVDLKNKSVFEVGCGDGFLTREIVAQHVKRLWVFEIDPAWAQKVSQECSFEGFKMHTQDFLTVDLSCLQEHAPWIMLSNLPYHLTFPILHRIQAYRHVVSEGVLMMQEEVAQKIVKTGGRGYGYASLFFQYYFEWKLLVKIPPTAFYPHPKVFSRLLYFKTKQDVTPIAHEVHFWKFIRFCFAHPRRTLRNNLSQTHIDLSLFSAEYLDLRAQQMSIGQFLSIWETVQSAFVVQE